MIKRIILFILLMSFILPAFAQEDTPDLAIERAISVAEEVLGSRALNFTFQLQNTTTNSNLGCPLVTNGATLPFAVTPVQVNLTYPDGIYVVLSSISGQIVVLCDAKFGDAMNNQA